MCFFISKQLNLFIMTMDQFGLIFMIGVFLWGTYMVVNYNPDAGKTNIPRPQNFPTPYKGPYTSSNTSPSSANWVIPGKTEAEKYAQWKEQHDREVQRTNDHWNTINLDVLRSKQGLLQDYEQSQKERLEEEERNRMFRNY